MAEPAVCVYCRRRAVEPRWRPFCSKRCQLLDLARWVDGDYRIAGEAAADADTPESGAEARPPVPPVDPDDRP